MLFLSKALASFVGGIEQPATGDWTMLPSQAGAALGGALQSADRLPDPSTMLSQAAWKSAASLMASSVAGVVLRLWDWASGRESPACTVRYRTQLEPGACLALALAPALAVSWCSWATGASAEDARPRQATVKTPAAQPRPPVAASGFYSALSSHSPRDCYSSRTRTAAAASRDSQWPRHFRSQLDSTQVIHSSSGLFRRSEIQRFQGSLELSLSKMITLIPFLGLAVQIVLASYPHQLNSRGPPAGPSIASLFSVPAGQKLTYPAGIQKSPQPRPAWVQAYKKAKAAGKIPSIPKSTVVDGVAVYPSSFHGKPCNFGSTLCNATSDIRTVPAGTAGISFDDGPANATPSLLKFLRLNNQKATHFLIGSQILPQLASFRALDQAHEHLAVHTFTHSMTTSLTDEEILGELGWTMQIIHDFSVKKHIPHYWRPPYGDVDERVRAIAHHVFNLRTVTWNLDPRDWCLADWVPNGSACKPGSGPQNLEQLKGALSSFAHQPKKNGLLVLEHETHARTEKAFEIPPVPTNWEGSLINTYHLLYNYLIYLHPSSTPPISSHPPVNHDTIHRKDLADCLPSPDWSNLNPPRFITSRRISICSDALLVDPP
ncbi:hypothetical protein O181_006452 [Austropuccinia psidii MF-1]|uniref:chitin deacetylase n=1 Tax=Austropuccinia psidii MF-1 TaxID=1389203 RepID=A0A9Q3GHL9_9BASI|nr:hypothetical protein [Austropuccinia psidii MF-1]